jgi:Kinase associated domain 1
MEEVAVRASTSAAPTPGTKLKPEKPRPKIKNKEYTKLKYHSGPIDQRALSSKSPEELIVHLEKVLTDMGLNVEKTSDEYKLRATRPSDNDSGMTNFKNGSGSDVSGLGAPDSLGGKDRRGTRLAHMLTTFPLTLMRRFKYIAQYGTQYNSGFDSMTDPSAFMNAPAQRQKEIRFYISVQRIRNLDGLLIVHVNRLRGDIWQFKKLYHDIVPSLSLMEFQEYQD